MSISGCFALAAAQASTEPSIGVVVATGITIVFGVLLLLYFLISLEGVIFTKIDNKKKGIKPAQKEAPKADNSFAKARASAAPANVEKGIPAEVVAAISAAIAAMEGGTGYAIRSLTRAKKGRSAWGGAGVSSYTEPF